MMKMYNPPHPGEVLRDLYLNPLGLTVTDTAKGLGVTRKAISDLLNGHSGISPTMALRLAKAFDTTPEIWMNLQQQYELWQAQKKASLKEVCVFT